MGVSRIGNLFEFPMIPLSFNSSFCVTERGTSLVLLSSSLQGKVLSFAHHPTFNIPAPLRTVNLLSVVPCTASELEVLQPTHVVFGIIAQRVNSFASRRHLCKTVSCVISPNSSASAFSFLIPLASCTTSYFCSAFPTRFTSHVSTSNVPLRWIQNWQQGLGCH